MIRHLFTLLVQELHRPLRRTLVDLDPEPGYSDADHRDGLGRQTRRCPFCRGWFNSTELQDAHERDCDQRPTAATPAEVLALAFPDHDRMVPERYAPPSYSSPVGEYRRHILGRWSA